MCLKLTSVSLLHSNSSTPDVSLKPRVSEASELQAQQHNGAPYLPLSRTPFPAVSVDQSISNYSGRTQCLHREPQSTGTGLITHFIPPYRKPDHCGVRHLGQPSGILRLLCHVSAILLPEPILDVLPTRA